MSGRKPLWELGWHGNVEELPDVPKPESLCGDWLRKGSLNLFHSRAGKGKTALMVDMLYAMKTGGQWLGQETADPGRVLFVNGDMDMWQVRERIGFARGIKIHHIPFVNLMNYSHDLKKMCCKYGLVVFDNRACLFGIGDANAAESWEACITLLRQIAHAGTTVILVTHSGKGEVSSAFGSSAQEWLVDTVVAITSEGASRSVEWQKVRGPEPEKTAFHLTMVDGRLMAIAGDSPELVVEPVETDNIQAMLNVLDIHGPLAWQKLRNYCRMQAGPVFLSEHTGKRMLDGLVEQGLVVLNAGQYSCKGI